MLSNLHPFLFYCSRPAESGGKVYGPDLTDDMLALAPENQHVRVYRRSS
jgi:hypothetical protein